jgi:hypothetical protein
MATKTDKEYYREWKKLVNMTASELKDFMQTKEGKKAGLSAKEAKEKGISRGRDSAKAILEMKSKPYSNWDKNDKKWMKKQVNFIKRFKGMSKKYPLYKKGKPTRLLTALKIWGHDPKK